MTNQAGLCSFDFPPATIYKGVRFTLGTEELAVCQWNLLHGLYLSTINLPFPFLFFSASYLNVHGKGRISAFYLLFLFLRLQWHNLPFPLSVFSISFYSVLQFASFNSAFTAVAGRVVPSLLTSIHFLDLVSCKDNVTVLFLLLACLYYWYFQEILQCAYRKSEVDIMGLNLLF